MQKMLEGGKMHMLTHRNWKFEKFMTMKIQTNDLKEIRATTGDNVLLETTANVNWRIADVALAAKMAAETMRHDGKNIAGEDITKLREDVLKQCTASLSAFVGSIRYSDSVHVSTATAAPETSSMQRHSAMSLGQPGAGGQGMAGAATLFDKGKLRSAVTHANDVCSRYGVEVITINIISAFPNDRKLVEALAAGAVAAAEAEQAETAAEGAAKALMIKTKAEADAKRICAEADADSERIRADGSKDAGDKLEKSNVAVELARIQKSGEALDGKQSFFFGASGPDHLPALLANSALVPGNQGKPSKSSSLWG
jgi:regulator of protease activity HflC (stomatin/prohibitin superfamily)